MSYVVTERVPENYMTETEVKDLVSAFNLQLKGLALQVSELEKATELLEEKLSKEKSRNNTLTTEIHKKIEEIHKIEQNIQIKAEVLQLAENQLRDLTGQFTKVHWDSTEIDLSQIHELLNYLDSLESTSIVLSSKKTFYSSKLSIKNREVYTKLQCINCKIEYFSFENTSGCCKYHPGKLKYFSCKGCGADPYYECCIQCKTCSAGCKSSSHKS